MCLSTLFCSVQFPWSFPASCISWGLNAITCWVLDRETQIDYVLLLHILRRVRLDSPFGMNPRAASATRALLRLSLCHWVCLGTSKDVFRALPTPLTWRADCLLKAQYTFPRSVRISRTTRVRYWYIDFVLRPIEVKPQFDYYDSADFSSLLFCLKWWDLLRSSCFLFQASIRAK